MNYSDSFGNYIRKTAKFIWWKISPRTYRNWVPKAKQEFSIGVAIVENPLEIFNSQNLEKPTITFNDVTDVAATFVADPFIYLHNNKWYMFFEVKNTLSNLGEIGLAISSDAIHWKYSKIVLSRRFHLSYPYVFKYKENIYMLPEASRSYALTLYKSMDFPYKWIPAGKILEGQRLADSSIFEHNGKLWLFTDAGKDTKNPVLRLYHSDDLFGPWKEHSNSPILENDPHKSRPAGRIIKIGSNLIRFAQDIYPVYGSRVFAFKITKLSTAEYEEEEVENNPILSAGKFKWNQGGMHHIDALEKKDGTWIACVDGFWSPSK